MHSGKIIYGLLANDATIGVGSRVYPLMRPQGTALPAIVYEEYAANPADTKDGVSEVDAIRVEITVIAATYPQARSIIGAVRAKIDRYKGTVGDVVTDGIKYIDTQDLPVSRDTDAFKVVSDYQIRIKNPI